jgi:DNA repair photolyase
MFRRGNATELIMEQRRLMLLLRVIWAAQRHGSGTFITTKLAIILVKIDHLVRRTDIQILILHLLRVLASLLGDLVRQ